MIPPFPLLFFGGEISIQHDDEQETVAVDKWIMFQASVRIAELVKVIVLLVHLFSFLRIDLLLYMFINYLYIYPFIHLLSISSVYISIYPSLFTPLFIMHHPFIHPSTHLFIYSQFIHPSIHPSIYPSIHSSIHPSIHPSTHQFTHPSIHPHTWVHTSIHQPIHLSTPSFIQTTGHA